MMMGCNWVVAFLGDDEVVLLVCVAVKIAHTCVISIIY